MAQLVEQSPPTPELYGLNPVIDKKYIERLLYCKQNETWDGPFKKEQGLISFWCWTTMFATLSMLTLPTYLLLASLEQLMSKKVWPEDKTKMKNSGSMSLPPFTYGPAGDCGGVVDNLALDENRNKIRIGFKQNPTKDKYLKFALSHSLIYNSQVGLTYIETRF